MPTMIKILKSLGTYKTVKKTLSKGFTDIKHSDDDSKEFRYVGDSDKNSKEFWYIENIDENSTEFRYIA